MDATGYPRRLSRDEMSRWREVAIEEYLPPKVA
jgi:hypothetical protein